MLAYSLIHIANALLFAGVLGATFLFNEDENTSAGTTPTDTDDDETSDGLLQSVIGDDSDNILTSTDPDGAEFFANGGDDSITGTDQADSLQAGQGNDTADMGAGDDRALGKAGNDTLIGGAGNDDLFGGSDNDDLFGGLGNDTLTGGFGSDSLFGSDGTDDLHAGEGEDILDGGEGSDELYGDAGDDTLWGANGSDTLFGGDGNDVLSGAFDGISTAPDGSLDGFDMLFGGTGDDTILMGASDIAEGGEGADTFTIDETVSGAGISQINDFDPSEDLLELQYLQTTDETTGDPVEPTLVITNFDDGTGAFFEIDGEIVAEVVGAQDLDPSLVSLIPVLDT